jgi:hypothetical protein
MKMIDLGTSPEESSMPVEAGKDSSEKYYPSLYLSDKEGLSSAPETGKEGTATIKFRVASKSKREDKSKGLSESVELEILGISFSGTSSDSSLQDDEIEAGLSDAEKADETTDNAETQEE